MKLDPGSLKRAIAAVVGVMTVYLIALFNVTGLDPALQKEAVLGVTAIVVAYLGQSGLRAAVREHRLPKGGAVAMLLALGLTWGVAEAAPRRAAAFDTANVNLQGQALTEKLAFPLAPGGALTFTLDDHGTPTPGFAVVGTLAFTSILDVPVSLLLGGGLASPAVEGVMPAGLIGFVADVHPELSVGLLGQYAAGKWWGGLTLVFSKFYQ